MLGEAGLGTPEKRGAESVREEGKEEAES